MNCNNLFLKKHLWLVFVFCSLTENSYASAEKLPVPRFVCLRAKKVNVHVGPGKEYPTEWTFVRQDMPVEIIAEFDTWRQVKDHEGTTGWVHKSLLSGRRTGLVTSETCTLLSTPENQAKTVAILKKNVLLKLKECKGNWCRVDANGHTGWIPRSEIWGVYDHEEKMK